MGETSGAAIRALSLGKPLVVSDVGWFSELPDEVALKVPVDEREVGDARRGARALAADEPSRRRWAPRRASSSSASTRCRASPSCTRPRSRRPPGGAAVRDAVLREVAEAAADVGIDAARPAAGELAARLRRGRAWRLRRRRPAAPRERAWSLARAVPVWAWLAGLVVLSTAIRYASRGRPSRRGSWSTSSSTPSSRRASPPTATSSSATTRTGSYGFVYPILIAPGLGAVRPVPDAYAAAKGINSLVMSLAAVPAYFLARRVLGAVAGRSPRPLLAVAIPSMVYTGDADDRERVLPALPRRRCSRSSRGSSGPRRAARAVLLALCLLAYLTRRRRSRSCRRS